MKYFVTIGDEVVEVELRGDRVLVDGREWSADLASVPGTTVHSLLLEEEGNLEGKGNLEEEGDLEGKGNLEEEGDLEGKDNLEGQGNGDGESHRLGARRRGRGRWELTVDGRSLDVEVLDRRGKAIRDIRERQAALAGPEPVRAPMPGLVVTVEVEPGQEVATGDGVAVVEAMKMENELSAPADARVKAVHVAPGDSVAKDQVLVEFEPPGGQAGEGADDGGDGS